jgi:hypothetical protein
MDEIPALVKEYRKLIRCLYPWQAIHVYPKIDARIVMIHGDGRSHGLLYGSQHEQNIKVLQACIKWKREQWR